MPSLNGLTPSNTVFGTLDDPDHPVFYPLPGSTDADGKATYRVQFTNTGTVPLTEVDLVSILPYFGDRAVSATEGSAWDMKLDTAHPNGAIEPMRRLDVDGTSLALPGDYTLAYSPYRNPCRFTGGAGVGLTLAGAPFEPDSRLSTLICETDSTLNTPWTATDDQAQSLAIRYRPLDAMLPGEKVEITINVRRDSAAPQLPTGVAWSTMAFTAKTSEGDWLLTNTPRVGGVQIVDASPAFRGVVWNDRDKDGIRDDTERLLSGVAVEAFDPVTNTIAGRAVTTSTGSYFINGLAPSHTYRIRFSGTPLVGLAPTVTRALLEGAPAPTVDSDVGQASSPFEITNAETGAKYVTPFLDAGFIPAPDESRGVT
jgi:SdrD B-like domain